MINLIKQFISFFLTTMLPFFNSNRICRKKLLYSIYHEYSNSINILLININGIINNMKYIKKTIHENSDYENTILQQIQPLDEKNFGMFSSTVQKFIYEIEKNNIDKLNVILPNNDRIKFDKLINDCKELINPNLFKEIYARFDHSSSSYYYNLTLEEQKGRNEIINRILEAIKNDMNGFNLLDEYDYIMSYYQNILKKAKI